MYFTKNSFSSPSMQAFFLCLVRYPGLHWKSFHGLLCETNRKVKIVKMFDRYSSLLGMGMGW